MQLIKYISFFAIISFIEVASANPIKLFQTQFDTDWTSSGFGGMRGVGKGKITLKGVRGTIKQAYLYWHGPTSSKDPKANAHVNFNGKPITGSNIGFSDGNYWNYSNSQAYRADVTAYVSGDGTYSLSGFIKPKVEINGVSLIIFFDDGNDSNNVDVVLFDGNDANFKNEFDPPGWNITLNDINYTSGTVYMNFGVSDGQNYAPNDDGNLTVNGTVVASKDLFQGDSVPNGTGGVSNGGLWDFLRLNITKFLVPGKNTLNITMSQVKDALSVIHVAIELPVGAAPGQPLPPVILIPEPEPELPQAQALPLPCLLVLPSFILVLLIVIARHFYIRRGATKR